MKSFKYLFCFILFLSLIIGACTQAPEFDDSPEIAFLSFSKSAMVQNQANTDSLFMTISFKDGDGDIGTGAEGIKENIILIDSRTGITYDRFKVPTIPVSGTQNGIEGEITMKVFTTCCRFEGLIPPCSNPIDTPTNEFFFEVYMVDDSGNESNRIQSEMILLECK